MATAIIDMSDLVGDENEPDPPRLQLGDTVVELPPYPTASFLSAVSFHSWARANGSEVDKSDAQARLTSEISSLAGPLDGHAPTNAIFRAILDAYGLGEGSASSD